MKNNGDKLKVGIFFGGQSAEHEVSIVSAKNIIKSIDKNKYYISPIYIDIKGKFHFLDSSGNIDNFIQKIKEKINIADNGFVLIDSKCIEQLKSLDVAINIIHGNFGEDGVMQGFFELLKIPYTSTGVLSSAISMDKEIAKKIVSQEGIEVTPYDIVQEDEFCDEKIDDILKKLSFPLFVKPVNCGSSIGICKAINKDELNDGIRNALLYDNKVLIEKCIDCREIEVSILENIDDYEKPIVSFPGELIPNDQFYTYEAKYIMKNGADFNLPAKISPDIAKDIMQKASEIFKILNFNCLARVDFFLENKTNKVFFNEINSLPGFTEISLYPKLLEISGISCSDLIDRLIDVAIKKFKNKQIKIANITSVLDKIAVNYE
jgi:D-alanine-D-alanine ligase